MLWLYNSKIKLDLLLDRLNVRECGSMQTTFPRKDQTPRCFMHYISPCFLSTTLVERVALATVKWCNWNATFNTTTAVLVWHLEKTSSLWQRYRYSWSQTSTSHRMMDVEEMVRCDGPVTQVEANQKTKRRLPTSPRHIEERRLIGELFLWYASDGAAGSAQLLTKYSEIFEVEGNQW